MVLRSPRDPRPPPGICNASDQELAQACHVLRRAMNTTERAMPRHVLRISRNRVRTARERQPANDACDIITSNMTSTTGVSLALAPHGEAVGE